MYTARNIHDDVSTRTRAITAGGIGAMHLLAQHTGLVDALDRHVGVPPRDRLVGQHRRAAVCRQPVGQSPVVGGGGRAVRPGARAAS